MKLVLQEECLCETRQPQRPLHEVNSRDCDYIGCGVYPEKYRFQEIAVTLRLLFLRLIITLVVEQGDAVDLLRIDGRRHHPVNF